MADERTDSARVGDAMVTVHKMHTTTATVDAIREFFANDHVHMALVVDGFGRLVTTLERSDLPDHHPGDASAAGLGTLVGRTVRESDRLGPLTEQLRNQGRRRMAVVDDAGRLVGLLCFKRSGRGYCTDEGIRARAEERGTVVDP